MDHAAALGDTAQVTELPAHLKLHRDFFFLRVGGHDGTAGFSAPLGRKLRNKRRNPRCDGCDGKRLSDDAGGSHHHVIRRDSERIGQKTAHGLGNLDAVGVAGIGIAAVADHRLSLAVGDVALRHGQGCALDEVRGIDSSGIRLAVTDDEGQVLFIRVLPDPAVNARSFKAFGGTDAAADRFDR